MTEFQPKTQILTRQEVPVDDYKVNDPTPFDGVVIQKDSDSITICYSQSQDNCSHCPRSLNCPASPFNRLN